MYVSECQQSDRCVGQSWRSTFFPSKCSIMLAVSSRYTGCGDGGCGDGGGSVDAC